MFLIGSPRGQDAGYGVYPVRDSRLGGRRDGGFNSAYSRACTNTDEGENTGSPPHESFRSYCSPAWVGERRGDDSSGAISPLASCCRSRAGIRAETALWGCRMMLSSLVWEVAEPMGADAQPHAARASSSTARQLVPPEGLGWRRRAARLRVQEPDEALSISKPPETCRLHCRRR